jgi:hypothetical protein
MAQTAKQSHEREVARKPPPKEVAPPGVEYVIIGPHFPWVDETKLRGKRLEGDE